MQKGIAAVAFLMTEIAAGASTLAMTCKTKPVIASEFTSVVFSRMEHVRRLYMTTVKFHYNM